MSCSVAVVPYQKKKKEKEKMRVKLGSRVPHLGSCAVCELAFNMGHRARSIINIANTPECLQREMAS